MKRLKTETKAQKTSPQKGGDAPLRAERLEGRCRLSKRQRQRAERERETTPNSQAIDLDPEGSRSGQERRERGDGVFRSVFSL
ncbi:hypothetical protein RchiOBHm_Chr7g0215221 [Rosa chinensis]|uniref:Uncharacterized protein n=1 Tax=Rosa chinensis TaxID=74649 RepID=A0A2P6PBF3_ROSCH|nr:hypothetical protein RchiOBHm_Chr7g0215221 [Rosa chinensis]